LENKWVSLLLCHGRLAYYFAMAASVQKWGLYEKGKKFEDKCEKNGNRVQRKTCRACPGFIHLF